MTNIVPNSLSRLLLMGAVASVLATQARFPATGFGVSELLGAALIVGCLLNRPVVDRSFLLLVCLFLSGIVIGGVTNLVRLVSQQISIRDLVAVVYAIAFASAAISFLARASRPVISLAVALTLAVFVQVVPLVLLADGIVTNSWLGDTDEPGLPFVSRYTGFSDNPNQLGVLLCGYPLVAWWALQLVESRWLKAFFFCGCTVAILLAVLVQSNTVFSAYLLAASAGIMLKVIGFGARPRSRTTFLLQLVGAVLVGLVALGAFLLYADTSIGKTGERDANGRFNIWHNAFDGIGQSYFLGVGPGGQAGEDGPFEGEEAHNVLLDISLQGGLMSLASYIGIIVFSFRRAWTQRSVPLICILVAILTEQMAHYTLRQPLGWMYLLLPLVWSPAGLPITASPEQASPLRIARQGGVQ